MTQGVKSVWVAAPAGAVFDVIHDYSIRLEWDTMLSEAGLIGGAVCAEKGAITRCVGHGWLKLFPVEAQYLTFQSGVVAAVKMVNKSLLFKSFSASIRHKPEGSGSTVAYRYAFEVKPWFLAWLLRPIVRFHLQKEVEERLNGLKKYCENRGS